MLVLPQAVLELAHFSSPCNASKGGSPTHLTYQRATRGPSRKMRVQRTPGCSRHLSLPWARSIWLHTLALTLCCVPSPPCSGHASILSRQPVSPPRATPASHLLLWAWLCSTLHCCSRKRLVHMRRGRQSGSQASCLFPCRGCTAEQARDLPTYHRLHREMPKLGIWILPSNPSPQIFAHRRAAPMYPSLQCSLIIHPDGPHLHLLWASTRWLCSRLKGNRAKGLGHQNSTNPFFEEGKLKFRTVIL